MLPKPTTCRGCPLYELPLGKQDGWTNTDGTGENGVLVVLEASGEHEEQQGIPTVGKAGYYLWQAIKRVGLDRNAFKIANVIACRPPNNELTGTSYKDAAIAHCAPNLDATIHSHVAAAQERGQTPVIVTLGQIALERVLGCGPFNKHNPFDSYLTYAAWSEKYQAWVMPTFHPRYIMRGNHHLALMLQFVAQRAVQMAKDGYAHHRPTYLCDPDPARFAAWVAEYAQALRDNPATMLAVDIETPWKQGKNEAEVAKEDNDDYNILRCSFAFRENEAVSVPWRAEWIPIIEELLASAGVKLFHNERYDVPRIRANGIAVEGDIWDTMLMWHVLNSALDKGLALITPFYATDFPRWKQLSSDQPAVYNAMDADATLRIAIAIKKDLIQHDLWKVFERHVVDLNRVLTHMSAIGVARDEVTRKEAEVKLTALLEDVEVQMQAAVPEAAKRLHPKGGYAKTPKDTTGLVQAPFQAMVKRCGRCGAASPTASHFKPIKTRKGHEARVNPCEGAEVVAAIEEVQRWAKVEEFTPSKVQMLSYQKELRHKAIINRKEHKETFDEDAIKKLIKLYPKDALYPLILRHREYQKLLGTYIGRTNEVGKVVGGLQIGRDGRIHAEFSHNPSTLRLACQNPNMQNLKRTDKDATAIGNIVRNLIVAGPGKTLIEFDYAAIEAVLVGYFARMPDYIRLAKMGVHSYLASHILKRPADLKWSDADLKAYFKEIKSSDDPIVNRVYNGAKRAIHLSAYGGTPRKMAESEPEVFPTSKYAAEIQAIYYDLFPGVKKWQYQIMLDAEKDGYLRNPFGYVHRFLHVFRYEKVGGQWEKKNGDDANKVLAFLPQSTAAAIIKEAMLRLYEYEEVRDCLRLQVHDSLLAEVDNERVDVVGSLMKAEMEKPVPQLALPKSYNMGPYLVIETDSKRGKRWGECH